MKSLITFQVGCAIFAVAAPLLAEIGPVKGVTARDVPNDSGTAIEVSWEAGPPEGVRGYRIIRFEGEGDEGEAVGEVTAVDDSFIDNEESTDPVRSGVRYRYLVRTEGTGGRTVDSRISNPVVATPSWLHTGRLVNLGAVVVFVAMFFFLVNRGKKGKPLYIRPIDALDEMDDAVGRAAEMGRPVFYAPGLHSVTQPATVASISLLSRVAERAARLHTPVKVPNYDPLTWPVAQEVVRQAFAKAGRPEEYQPQDVSYLTSRSFTYAAAVTGIMVRERTASNFLIGHFYSEYLILAETGVSTGALQIGGTDSVAQLPFFITTCDRTMIGEELFAAAAIAGDDPVSRSTIKAHDWFKALLMVAILAGAILGVLGDTGLLEGALDILGLDDPAGLSAAITDTARGLGR